MIIATNENVFGGKETDRKEREREKPKKRRKNEHDFSIGYVDAGRTMNIKQAI